MQLLSCNAYIAKVHCHGIWHSIPVDIGQFGGRAARRCSCALLPLQDPAHRCYAQPCLSPIAQCLQGIAVLLHEHGAGGPVLCHASRTEERMVS